MTDHETETPLETETTESLEAETPETESSEPSWLQGAPGALTDWLVETRDVMQRHWDLALDRARTRLEPAESEPAATPEVASLETIEGDEVRQTPLRVLLSHALVTRAQERGANLLLGSMRRLRANLETLEANLEAARPDPEAALG
ncbi:MAG: hypothetical protein JKY65_04265 [Planctomycetes bacterium]|nr:hypothetical protein [Planctomycetota bacterium]